MCPSGARSLRFPPLHDLLRRTARGGFDQGEIPSELKTSVQGCILKTVSMLIENAIRTAIGILANHKVLVRQAQAP
jgi:hypothetical protein